MNIRNCEMKDASNFLNMLLALDNETKFMLLEPGERRNDVTRTKSMIEQSIKGDTLLLVADIDGEIVGFLSAQKGVPKRIRHSAYIVIGIREAYRGMGIGSKFFSELDLWAKDNNISRLELTVMCSNTIAKDLYEKNGFVVEGIKRNSILLDGEYIDEYYMAKLY